MASEKGRDAVHIHLDPVGGVAGDMFVAALLELRPELAAPAIAALRSAGLAGDLSLAHVPFSDGTLCGGRFEVSLSDGSGRHDCKPDSALSRAHALDHGGEHGHGHAHISLDRANQPVHRKEHTHSHVHWRDIRRRMDRCDLDRMVRSRAIEIFALLADAEARVHQKAVDDVSFHEVGAWDSIADIVAAAFLIEAIMPLEWSVGPIPVGSGVVSTAHGRLPVPAPATALLLDGFYCFDDGVPGERVTPTGAAILRHLQPSYGMGRIPRRLRKSAYGFGTRRLPGMSNVLRALEFGPMPPSFVSTDQVAVIDFEIDDQTPEDLAEGLDRLRAVEGAIDVTQHAVTGKRGRAVAGIRILARPERTEAVAAACFSETTTLGLRLQVTDRLMLPRRETHATGGVRVKLAERPSGITAKADIQDVASRGGHFERQALRDRAVSEVVEK